MRRIFHLLRQYAGASQTRIGIACGLTQGKVSAIMSGSHRITALEVFERIADGLGMPPEARLALGLAPSALYLGSATAIPPRDGRGPQLPWPAPGALIVDSPGPSDAEDPVRRRTFTRLAGASFVGAVFADRAVGIGPLREAQSLVTALVTPESGLAAAQPAEFSALTKAVANAKRAYQACR
jgi:transcriptional regulator with XRE-family HTH domain